MGATRRKLLFIEPQEPPTQDALLDAVTRKMCAAYRRARRSDYAYGGVHTCRCGANSDCQDHFLPDRTMTNSLCVHYVAHHRASVPAGQLRLIESFPWGEAEPTEEELVGQQRLAASRRQSIERSLGSTWCAWGLDVQGICECLSSYESQVRAEADTLLSFLINMRSRSGAVMRALERLRVDAKAWAAAALRLPNWDRAAWVAPMIELLSAEDIDERERHRVAFMFRYLHCADTPVPPELTALSERWGGDRAATVAFAIQQLRDG